MGSRLPLMDPDGMGMGEAVGGVARSVQWSAVQQ